jgi:hypothetical protein
MSTPIPVPEIVEWGVARCAARARGCGRERAVARTAQAANTARAAAMIRKFGGDPHALAAEILRYRHSLKQMADAIDWTRQGAPFGVIPPGPYWGPGRTRIS